MHPGRTKATGCERGPNVRCGGGGALSLLL
nr:MAG TPA: hypothetical protein [Caudoviricetes sp.]